MSTAIVGVRPLEGKPLHRPSGQVPIRDHAGRVVGTVRVLAGRLAFVKTVEPELHQLRHPPAWCTDTSVLAQAAKGGAQFLCCIERASRRRWWAPLAAFKSHGFRIARGHGEQVGLALEFWHIEDPSEPQQLGLFAEGGSAPARGGP